jgi:23S rRNA-/tRNA-specific pseudouridylate synthase
MPKPQERLAITVVPAEHGKRLDRVLRGRFPGWQRADLTRLLSRRQITVNGRPVWLGSWQVSAGDTIIIFRPPAIVPPAPPPVFQQDWLLADQGDLLVVCKPAGLLSQPVRQSPGDRQPPGDDLLSLAQSWFGPDIRLFHRLDRDTSGLCLLTRPGPVNAYLDQAFKSRTVTKEYIALLAGIGGLEERGELRSYLDADPERSDRMAVVPRGGQYAHTEYLLLERGIGQIRIWLQPHTGRTHQLRVQLAAAGAPIIGDRMYGGHRADRLMLHAERIALPSAEDFPARDWTCPAPF